MAEIPKWKARLPLYATLSRIVVCPILIVLIMWDEPWARTAAMILYILASLTDYLDGYWARLYKVESTFGKLMDPVSDKIFVLTPLIMLVSLQRLSPLPVIILLARDSLIGGIRSVAAAENRIIAAQPLGKWKTGFQMVAIPALLLHDPLLVLPSHEIGLVCLWISVGLSLLSGLQYTVGYYRSK